MLVGTQDARRVPHAEIASEDYNCNIRRYVDNATPPEPHDVRVHLHGGVPITEVESLAHFWHTYPQLRDDAFKLRDESYVDFADTISDKRAIADFVATHQSVVTSHERFMQTLHQWWEENLPIVEALAPDADNQQARPPNVYVKRSSLLQSIESALVDQQLLTPFQVRGAIANYVDVLKADFKSITASGWGAELIPDEDILQSQFPEILEQQEQSQVRQAELQSLFAAADEEDFEDTEETGVLPSSEVNNKKEELKGCIPMAPLIEQRRIETALRSSSARKTTFALEYLPNVVGCHRFINADLIAAGISPLDPERDLLTASRLFLNGIESHIAAMRDFGFETTLSGRGYLKLICRLQSEGWCIELIYLTLPNVALSRQRVAERVQHGGHNIPAADIERRFPRSLDNLLNRFAEAVDFCQCYMNSSASPELVFEQRGDARTVLHPEHYRRLVQESGV